MDFIPKFLITAGIILIVTGLIWTFGAKFLPFGRLPGDIAVERGNFRFYFPVTTSILLSIVLTLFLWAIARFIR